MHAATPLLRLASSSPRRKLILKLVGIPFVVEPADVSESVGHDDPAQLAVKNASLKALASAARFGSRLPAWTLGADTIVIVDATILGKPADEADARRMMERLSGRTHEVITGWALAKNGALVMSDHSVTTVTFRSLPAARIDDYVRDGEWIDKAGGYAIQGRGAHLITRIEGDAFNVMGLPVGDVVEALLSCGVIPRYPL